MPRRARDRRKRKQEKKLAEDQKLESAVVESKTASQWKEKGNKAFASRDYDTALEHYTRAIKEDSKNASLYSNRYVNTTCGCLEQYAVALGAGKWRVSIRPCIFMNVFVSTH